MSEKPTAYPIWANKETEQLVEGGLEMRDWFAGMVLPTLVEYSYNNNFSIHGTAREAYVIADAMMKARKGQQNVK